MHWAAEAKLDKRIDSNLGLHVIASKMDVGIDSERII